MALHSHRLNSFRSFRSNEQYVWDIGCDHGDLGLSFLNEEGVLGVNLVDPSESVIKKLELKKASYITKIPFLNILKQKGEDLNISNKNNIFYIAGMGGKEIHKILKNLQNQVGVRDKIIISPHRHIFELRTELSRGPWMLEQEKIIFENDQFYQVLVLSLNASFHVQPFGIDIWKGEIGQMYSQHVRKFLQHHQDQLSKNLLEFIKSI